MVSTVGESDVNGRIMCYRCGAIHKIAACGVAPIQCTQCCNRNSKQWQALPEANLETVNHPHHYTANDSGVECITVAEHFNFCLGNALKYIWRADLKGGIEDLEKARWYIDREITRRNKESK